ncbi:hypothetical protein [Actinoplanes rectilineatus]|uniref:hypothetical protein n=1 Tax=Actinoplanes rectilineatus TaxID=113571 RepID=UPI0012F97002|nr:hypothetical protein [Actinoplanes rectilineatus]
MTVEQFRQVAADNAVVVADSDGRTVAVFRIFTTLLVMPQTDRRLALSDREIEEIGRGESWIVEDRQDRAYGWTVSVAA